MKNKILIIAELSANHKQDFSLAKESLYAIKECGASAVKLQTYTPESLTLNCKSKIFKIKGTIWEDKYLYDLYEEAYMPLDWNAELFNLARELDLLCFSSAFDTAGVDLLESLGNPIYKIASFEITDIPLISYIASKGKPIILSSGIATQSEISEAINAIRLQGCEDITLLKCTSAYPSKIGEMNILEMVANAQKHGVKYGLSDHSLGVNAAIVAASLGAEVIEKHFILDKRLGGVDSAFSLDKNEFKILVDSINESVESLGALDYRVSVESSVIEPSEIKGREFARSLFVSADIKKGEVFSVANIRSVRPNNGLPPKYLPQILGKTAKCDLAFGKPLEFSDIDGEIER